MNRRMAASLRTTMGRCSCRARSSARRPHGLPNRQSRRVNLRSSGEVAVNSCGAVRTASASSPPLSEQREAGRLGNGAADRAACPSRSRCRDGMPGSRTGLCQMMKSVTLTMPSPLASPAGAGRAEVLLPDAQVEVVNDAVAVEVGADCRHGGYGKALDEVGVEL